MTSCEQLPRQCLKEEDALQSRTHSYTDSTASSRCNELTTLYTQTSGSESNLTSVTEFSRTPESESASLRSKGEVRDSNEDNLTIEHLNIQTTTASQLPSLSLHRSETCGLDTEEHENVLALPRRLPSLGGSIQSANEPEEHFNAIDTEAETVVVQPAATLGPATKDVVTAPQPTECAANPLEEYITTVVPKPKTENEDPVARARGKRNITITKHVVQSWQIGANGFAIFATWWWPRYYYIFLPFITATVALNVIMVFSNIFTTAIRKSFWPEEKIVPPVPESLVLMIPCYNETKEELLKSLNSLIDQDDVHQHKRSIMVVCDGRVRGPGMEKTTGNYLLQDIFTSYSVHEEIESAYVAYDQQFMNVVVRKGAYRGLPYLCIIKQQNQGKRDGLIVVRSFLYNFNIRERRPETIFSGKFFAFMARFLLEDADQTHVDHLIGMDADTAFDRRCIVSLLEESRYPNTVGVCGYVAVDFSAGQWNLWRLYQSAEYTIAQGLRRLHQSIVTHKVSCLPGCCQLLKICEETCGPVVLVEKFGYCPGVTDSLLSHIRATASEDRNHVCHMLSARPKVQTRQALAAKATTDVPCTWAVYLSQRRRWTLGATSNDLLLAFAPGVQWFERILAVVNVVTWVANPFIMASVASFIIACMHAPSWIIMAFVSVMLVPVTYYLCIPLWLHDNARDRIQFWLGCACYVLGGPFINIAVLLYASFYMDSFGWGKTRKVITEDLSEPDMADFKATSEQDSATKNERSHPVINNDTDRTAQIMEEEEKIGQA